MGLQTFSRRAKYLRSHFQIGGFMDNSKPFSVLCTYRVKEGKEADFLGLLEKHWPTLRGLGLATDEAARVMRCRDKSGRVIFVESFSWKDAGAPEVAHQTPEVMAVWEP